MPFVVKMLNRTAEVMWMGMATELPLAYAEGMIGCMPVFETREQAESFADGAYEITEIMTEPPNTGIKGTREAGSP